MTRTLRPYQTAAVEQVVEQLEHNCILVMPTGSGKTTTAVEIVRRLGRRTLWLAHRRELVSQARAELRSLELDVAAITAGEPENRRAQVQVASVATLVRRELPPAELVVIDEAHHAATGTRYFKLLEGYPGVPRLGLTATPFRLDRRPLGQIFGAVIVGAYTEDLCRDGTLVEPVVYAPDVPDLGGVRVRHGEFEHARVSAIMTRSAIVGNVVETWLARAAGKRTVAFCVDVDHSKRTVEAFRSRGVRFEHLDGSMSRTQRDAVLYRLRTGYTVGVAQCEVLTEGWDLPALEVAIVVRPTASLGLHLQMVGRIMRQASGKAGAILLDHAGNTHRHGPVTQRLEYSLTDRVRSATRTAPLRRCAECFLMVPLSAPTCPGCGHDFSAERPERRGPVEQDGELVKVAGPTMTFEELSASWERIERRREALGYKQEWSSVQFRQMHGHWPLVHEGKLVDPKAAGWGPRHAEFVRLREIGKAKGYKPNWAHLAYQRRFGHWPPKQWTGTGPARDRDPAGDPRAAGAGPTLPGLAQ